MNNSSDTEKKQSKWAIDLDETYPDDALLSCLMIITKYYQNPYSAAALSAGLPLVDNKLTPSLFERAAERAHLKSQIRKRKLKDIQSIALPAILLLDLLEKTEGGSVKIINPESGTGIIEISLEALNKRYLGQVIFVRPEFEFSPRGDEVFLPDKGHWFWSALKKTIPIYSEVLLASFFINLFALAVPFFILNVYDRVIPNHAFETLWVLAIGITIVFIFEFILRVLRGYFIDNASKTIDIKLSSSIFAHILNIEMGSRPQSTGAFANAVHSFEFFRDFITSTTITLLVDLPFVLLFLAVIYLIAGNMVLIPLIIFPIMLLIAFFLQKPLVNLTRKSYSYGAEKQAILIESIHGAETIKTSLAESAMQQRWERIVTLGARLGAKLRLLSNFGSSLSHFFQRIAIVLVVILGVYKVAEHQLSTGGLIACVIITRRTIAPISQLATFLIRYYQASNSLKALGQIMQLPTDRRTDKKTFHRPHVKGDIEFRNVSFSYPRQPILALNNISFSIKAGEKVALIGRIGSGKTTVAKLIMGLYQPSEGSLLLDNTEMHQLDPADVRKHMGYVPQDITLFYGTIRENITFGGNHIDDKEILRAAKIAGVDRFVDTHPDGYDMQVGERGQCLSGGQRQTIAIARSVLLKPPVFIFDEPTNSMDDNSETYFRKNFTDQLNSNTLILATHKAAMLSLVDRIIVFENGHIVADGPKEHVITALGAKSNVTSQETQESDNN